MLVQLIIFFTLLYLIFNFLLLYGWNRPGIARASSRGTIFLTVIVAVRNEEKNICRLLGDLDQQSYPANRFEVVIVNDHSDDRTLEVVSQFRGRYPIRIVDLEEPSGKKAAITAGIEKAGGQLILITDGDCRVGENWLESIAAFYEKTTAKFISAPVSFVETRGFVNKLLTIEFSSLIGAGAAMMNFKKPVMCNAANLAFEKQAFIEVGGFSGNENQASGDDVFLMRKIFERHPQKVLFNKDYQAMVRTYPESNLKKFYHQRVRWAGKWKKVGGSENKGVPISIFGFHLLFAASWVLWGMGMLASLHFLIIHALKFVGEYVFLSNVMKFSNQKASIVHYFIASLVYSFYAVFMGLAANFSGYHWKGRKYRLT